MSKTCTFSQVHQTFFCNPIHYCVTKFSLMKVVWLPLCCFEAKVSKKLSYSEPTSISSQFVCVNSKTSQYYQSMHFLFGLHFKQIASCKLEYSKYFWKTLDIKVSCPLLNINNHDYGFNISPIQFNVNLAS